MYPENENGRGLISIQSLIRRYEARLQQGKPEYFEEQTYLQLLEYFEAERLYAKALEAADQAVAHHPCSINLFLKKAQLLIDAGQASLAFSVIEQAQNLAPGEIEVQLLRAEASIAIGQEDEGLLLLEFLKEEASAQELSSILLVEALAYERKEAYERMFYTLKQALEQDPQNEGAIERIGVCALQCRKFEESIRLHEAILSEDAYQSIAWYNLAQAYLHLNQYELAVEAYEFAFTIDESFRLAYRECADLCLELQQFKKALYCYLELLEEEGGHADSDLYIQIGACHLRLGHPQTAITFYIRAAQLDPLNDEIFFSIGECYAAIGEWMNAVQYFEKAVEIEEEREEYFAALGEAYFNLGNADIAIDYLETAIGLNDIETRYWIMLAAFMIESGRCDQALQILEEGMLAAPSAEINYCRIACLFAAGRRSAALYWLSEALEEEYDMHTTLFELLPGLQHDQNVQSMIANYAV